MFSGIIILNIDNLFNLSLKINSVAYILYIDLKKDRTTHLKMLLPGYIQNLFTLLILIGFVFLYDGLSPAYWIYVSLNC